MKTSEQRESHFRKDLEMLLNRHGAEIELIDVGDKHYSVKKISVTMASIYDDSGSGDLLADFTEFDLST